MPNSTFENAGQGPQVGRVTALDQWPVVNELFWLSLTSLFLELVVIRWMAAEIRAFTIYKNFPLITCYIGLGGGFMLSGRGGKLYRLLPFLLLLLTALVSTSDWTLLSQVMAPSSRTAVNFLWFDMLHPAAAAVTSPLLFTGFSFVAFFALLVLVAFTFAALGARLGELFNQCAPLKAYLVNILGSGAGIAVFSLVAFLCLPPAAWMLVGLCPLIFFCRKRPLAVAALMCCLVLPAVVPSKGMPGSWAHEPVETRWSPYHRIDLTPLVLPATSLAPGKQIGYTIAVNKAYFQEPLNLSAAFLKGVAGINKVQERLLDQYDFSYEFLKPAKVLVLGSGTGNDVAAALRHGSTRIDAVEIDPVIVELGRQLHGEKPYQSDKVTVHVNDARAYLRQSADKYDLVLMGLLDSHTVAGNSLSVRLDDYVYTQDGLKDALLHVAPAGLLSISYCAVDRWIVDRLVANLRLACQSLNLPAPVLLRRPDSCVWHLIAPGSAAVKSHAAWLIAHGFKDFTELDTEGVGPSTDDWPYLYLRPALLDPTYLAVSLCVLLLAWAACGSNIRRFKSSSRWHLFFLGAGFLLLELAIIDRLSLVFGTTWLVNLASILGVLTAIFASNLLVLKKPTLPNTPVIYLGLFLSLAGVYLIPFEQLTVTHIWSGRFLAVGLSSIPVFFAGLLFSRSFSKEKEPSIGLAFNMFGAVVGGMLEYAAIYTGVRSLLVLSGALYLASLLALKAAGQEINPAQPTEKPAQ